MIDKMTIINRANDRLMVTSYPTQQISVSEHTDPKIHAILDALIDVLNHEIDNLRQVIMLKDRK